MGQEDLIVALPPGFEPGTKVPKTYMIIRFTTEACSDIAQYSIKKRDLQSLFVFFNRGPMCRRGVLVWLFSFLVLARRLVFVRVSF